MRLFIIVLISIISFYQAEAACAEELMKLFTQDVTNTELKLNITEADIVGKIEKTAEDVESVIKSTKRGILIEREKLMDLESAAYGKSLVKKKSIADCLKQDRDQMKVINGTESIIYSVCRADLSLLLVKLSIFKVNGVSRQLQKNLETCINDNMSNCENEKACIIKTLDKVNDELNSLNSKIETKLDKILHTSKFCADSKKDMVISMIKEQESKFNYCVEKILNGS